jgi:hypothetical protein
MNLFKNITDTISYVHKDFIGISFNVQGIGMFFFSLLFAGFILLTYYFLGEKIRKYIFKVDSIFNDFINIALAYIFIGTGIALLGAFGLLFKEVLLIYFILVLLAAFYPYNFSYVLHFFHLKRTIRNFIQKKNYIYYGVLLFVLISFLRLATPEITEDAYHTDLPLLYLKTHTSIHESKDPLHVIPYPQLAEMTYTIPLFFGQKETARILHFGFYVLIILLLFRFAGIKENRFTKYSPLLFATAPNVIRYSPSQYVDFFMVFCFLLSLFLIKKTMTLWLIILAGIILGGALATKLWVIAYLPVIALFVLYLQKDVSAANRIFRTILFVLGVISVPLFWYLRAFFITGNPLFPFFAKFDLLETSVPIAPPSSYYFGLNWKMFTVDNLIVISPLFFLAAILLLLGWRKIAKSFTKVPFYMLVGLLTVEHLFVRIDLGRYLLAWSTAAGVVASAGLSLFINRRLVKYIFVILYCLLFSYYFITTLFILPYGFGWADKNAYLTRVLGRDNASYYDFDKLFDKHISKTDLVATYTIIGYYYANFSYVDVNYIFSKKDRNFDSLKKSHVTKLIIKGGDIEWFCKILSLQNCDKNKVKLLAAYPNEVKKYFLYEIK